MTDFLEADETDELGIDYHASELGTLGFSTKLSASTSAIPKATMDAWSKVTKTPPAPASSPVSRPLSSPASRPLSMDADSVRTIRASTPGLQERENQWQDALVRQGYSRNGCPSSNPLEIELRKIKAQLALAQVQREATSEHIALERLTNYRNEVLTRLHSLLGRC